MRLLATLGQESLLLTFETNITALAVGSSVDSAIKAADKRLSVVRVDIEILDVMRQIVAVGWLADASEGLSLPKVELDQADAACVAGLKGDVFVSGVGAGKAGDESEDGEDRSEAHLDEGLIMCWMCVFEILGLMCLSDS
jgi:hypothetical protein